MSDDPELEETGTGTDPEHPSAVRRTLDLFVFAPVGLAVTALEDLPTLIVKGRQRVESEIRNARFIGQFVVTKGQRDLTERVSKLFADDSEPAPPAPAEGGGAAEDTSGAPAPGDAHAPRPPDAPVPPASAGARPAPDPADAADVERALPGYDTLSASQVVRRLESLDPDQLRAVGRHEASHRNRRTILNRTQQLLTSPVGDGPAPAPSPSSPPPGRE